MKLDFSKAIKLAAKVIKNPEKLKNLLRNADKKAGKVDGKGNKKIGGLLGKVAITARMLRAYIKGDYKNMPWKTILSLTAGLIYFVSPIDIVPDFLPVAGLLDDVSIFLYIFSKLDGDIEDFLNWEEGQKFSDFSEVD